MEVLNLISLEGWATSSSETLYTKTPEADPSDHPYPSYTVMKVGKEILATLQYYLEAFPLKDMPSSAINLFVATDLNQPMRMR